MQNTISGAFHILQRNHKKAICDLHRSKMGPLRTPNPGRLELGRKVFLIKSKSWKLKKN